MRVLSKQQCHDMPIDQIKENNQWWTQQLKNTDQYRFELSKYSRVDIVRFIKKHAPELEYQFAWVELSGSQRMALKYPYKQTFTIDNSEDFYNGVEIDDSEYLDYYYPEQ